MTIQLHEASTRDIADELARRCGYVVVIVGGSPDCDREGLEARMIVQCDEDATQRVCDVVMASMQDYARGKGCVLSLDDANGYEAGPYRGDG